MALKGKRLFHPEAKLSEDESPNLPLMGKKEKGLKKAWQEAHPRKELSPNDISDILSMPGDS